MAESSAAPPYPAIEVVVPTLDSHALLPRLVRSLQEQSWPHWRLCFIDGPSSAVHRAVLDQLCREDPRLHWTPQDPREPGIFGAMNQGAAQAPPEAWLLFWGSDDWAAGPTVLERLAARLQQRTRPGREPDLLVCRGRYEDGRASIFRWRHSYRRSLFLGSTPPIRRPPSAQGPEDACRATPRGFASRRISTISCSSRASRISRWSAWIWSWWAWEAAASAACRPGGACRRCAGLTVGPLVPPGLSPSCCGTCSGC